MAWYAVAEREKRRNYAFGIFWGWPQSNDTGNAKPGEVGHTLTRD